MTSVGFEDVKQGLSDNSIILLDVRSRDEHKKERIPKAKNVPLDEVKDAFRMSSGEFEAKYKFPKPDSDTLIVTHCLRGIRAANVMEMLQEDGYKNVKVYKGSFMEWKEKGGQIEAN